MTTKTKAKPAKTGTAKSVPKAKSTTMAPAAPPPEAGTKPPGGKLAVIITMLAQPSGATLAALMAATGWQAHSVRGALAGAVKKKGHTVVSEKTETGRVYRIAEAS